MLRRAVALDPGFSAAKGNLAGLICVRVTQGWAEAGEAAEALRCAREVAEAGGEDDPTALAWAAHALTYLGRDYDSRPRLRRGAGRVGTGLVARTQRGAGAAVA
jgi:hypothetical protein